VKLYEYMGKEIFKQHGILVPEGRVATNSDQVEDIAEEIGKVVIKSQILSGGRGKAGGIKFASSTKEAAELGSALLGSKIKDLVIDRVLVEEQIKIDQEIYLAITVDGSAKKPVIIASASGGVDIEDVPEAEIVKYPIDVFVGVNPYVGREIVRRLGFTGDIGKQIVAIIYNLYYIFTKYDAELVEINPLVISGDKVIAADSKITMDDEALFRVAKDVPRVDESTEREKLAQEIGVSYVQLDGDIAVMANGAGITMATLDIIQHYGGSPANFMDAGGGAGIEATAKALEILLAAKPKAILANIFGGITRCDDVAKAFAYVKANIGIPVPIVIRLVGTNEEEGIRILKEIGIESYRTMEEAASKVVALAKGNLGEVS
jgi:succinyl-CoA synthetase beta subunit